MINKEEIFKTLFRPGCLVWGWKNMACFEAWIHYCHVHLPFRLHLLDEGAVIQGLHCLPFRLHLLDEGAVWLGSTLLATPFASSGWRSSLIGSTLFAIPFASFGWSSSLIRVYTVCHSVCTVWMKEQSDQGLHCHSTGIVWMKEQSDQSLHCLPFHLHHLDVGAVWSGSIL